MQNSCRVRPLHYIVSVHRVRLADRIAGGPMAHFLFWPGGLWGSADLSPLGCHPSGGYCRLGGVGVLGGHQPYRAGDRAFARGDGLSSRSGGHHQRPPADAPGHGRAARRPADDGRGLRADQPLGLRHSRRRRSDRRRLHARDQLAGHRSSAGSRRRLRSVQRVRSAGSSSPGRSRDASASAAGCSEPRPRACVWPPRRAK